MNRKKLMGLTCLGLLAGAGVLLFVNTTKLARSRAATGPADESIRVLGHVRDFRTAHPDFDVIDPEGLGNHAGILRTALGNDYRPVFVGDGRKVLTEARDASGRVIAPHMANETFTCGVTDFEIIDGAVIPGESFAAMITLVDSAITSGGTDIPVTTRYRIGADEIEPFGSFDDPATGDVNDHTNPRHHIIPTVYPAGTPITAVGRSWISGAPHMTVDTQDDSPYCLVLRDGDDVPDIQPFEDQTSIAGFVAEYVDMATGKITLAPNQAIFLAELGVTDLTVPAADFQDTVTVLTLGRSGDDLVIPGEVVEVPPHLGDTEAVLSETFSQGGITDEMTFRTWFRDTPGQNLSASVPIIFVKLADGTYVFDDQMDRRYASIGGFFPIDDRLFGNETQSHNRHFSTVLDLRSQYDASAGQYLTYTGDLDAWVFIDDQLAIDLGGGHGVMTQRIDLDRLCLSDGQTFRARIFLAHRQGASSRVRLETNICFEATRAPSVSSQFD